MRSFFLALLLLALAVAHGRPLAAAPAAAKKATIKTRTAAAAPAKSARWAAAPAAAPWTAYAATSKQSAQFDAVEPQADVSLASPADLDEATALAVAEIVAEATGSEEDARNAAEMAMGE